MALRAVPDHPKFMAFKSMLRLPKGAALGWLESIWHFAGRFAPHGNIGKYSDAQIESWVEWDGAPGALIVALVECGWLDKSTQYRLLVHDWAQHADKATKQAVSRSQKPFIGNDVRTPGARSGHEATDSGTPYPLPVPVPDPVPVPGAGAVPAAPPPDDVDISPDMVAQAVLHECGISGMHVRIALEGQVKSLAVKPDYSPDAARSQLVERWQLYESQKHLLRITWSAEKFFGDGHWRTPNAWPRKDERNGNSNGRSGAEAARVLDDLERIASGGIA